MSPGHSIVWLSWVHAYLFENRAVIADRCEDAALCENFAKVGLFDRAIGDLELQPVAGEWFDSADFDQFGHRSGATGSTGMKMRWRVAEK